MKSQMKIILFFLMLLFGCASIPYIPVVDGDCADRALEIKRSLKEQGYETRVILGMRGNDGHAWVEYKDKKTGKWTRIDNY